MARTAFLHPFARPTAGDFTTIVAARGATVVDDAGRRYVDAMGSLWYCNIGHGRAEVADVVADQLRSLDAFHAFERFTNPPAERLCAELATPAPMPDARAFLTCSGSEAVDSALKIARLAHALGGEPDRRLVVSRRPSYHGVTYGGLAATGLPDNQRHFGAMLPDVVQVAHDDLEAVQRLGWERGDELAAVIAEPVVGAGGVYPPPPGYLEGLRRVCDDTGALLILDEVICGFGRLGTWWGAEFYGVVPDLVTFAKAVTSGYQPLGGVLVGPVGPRAPGGRRERRPAPRPHLQRASDGLRRGADRDRHHTAGGPAGARPEDRGAPGGRSARAGRRWARARGTRRGSGVGRGAAGAPPAPVLRDEMLARGVIPRPIGTDTLAFCPPLVIDDGDVDRCVTVLEEALTALERRGG